MRRSLPFAGTAYTGELGDPWPHDYCTYNSRNGESVVFFVQPAGSIATLDNAFAPVRKYSRLSDEYFGRNPDQDGPFLPDMRGKSATQRVLIDSDRCFHLLVGAKPTRRMWASISLVRTAQGNEIVQSLTVQTPNNSTMTLTIIFLYPKNTTQVITDPEGNVWRYTINSDREMTNVVGPDGSQVSISSYTGEHRVKTLTNAAGTWQYSYSSSDTYRTITRTNPLGGIATFKSHKDKGYIVEITDELGRTTYYDHDVGGTEYLAVIRYPEGNSLEFDYDARGNITERRAKAPGELYGHRNRRILRLM